MWILWGVKNCQFPLTSSVAVNTASATAQPVMCHWYTHWHLCVCLCVFFLLFLLWIFDSECVFGVCRVMFMRQHTRDLETLRTSNSYYCNVPSDSWNVYMLRLPCRNKRSSDLCSAPLWNYCCIELATVNVYKDSCLIHSCLHFDSIALMICCVLSIIVNGVLL